jgi:hypothetical protein
MTGDIHLLAPQVFGDRTIIPVVTDATFCYDNGMMTAVCPVALLIGEDDCWGIALLEGDSVPALLERIVLPA